MNRAAPIVLLAFVSACGLLDRQPAPVDPTTPTVTETTTTTLVAATSTSAVGDELITTSCPTEDADFTLLCEAVDLISRNYVDPIDEDALAAAAIEGLLTEGPSQTSPGPLTCATPSDSFLALCQTMEARDVAGDAIESVLFGMTRFALDPNSSYITPEALALIREEQTGSVEGIGALVTTEDRTSADPANTPCDILSDTCPLVIVSTLPGSPAAAAGVEAGDEFVAVDGDPVNGRSIDEVTTVVRGAAGTDVTITFARGDELIDITITRAAVEIPITQVESFGDVGYLRLNLFTGNAGDQVEEDLRSLLDAGATTIVFDLRDNPGGTLDAALDVTSEFIGDGLVVRTVGPDEELSYPVRADGVATDPAIEVIVLVNRGSASASEVVAGTLQERERALIVGETTFGKNTVQQRFPLSNGGAMRLTIARWITPEGIDFDDGIVPDLALELDADLTPAEIIDLVVG
jgi:carboxyl-terminal processing protease